MWDLLKKKDEECEKLRDRLGESAARRGVISLERLSEDWTAAERAHLTACTRCLEAAHELLASRRVLQGLRSYGQTERPWFANRVMAAIAARERELSEAASTWLAVPRFASRVALASGTLLLVVSTWLYEKPQPTPNLQATALAAQESIFEAPVTQNQDDVLVPAQENNR